MATESSDFTTWVSVSRTLPGKEWTTTSTAVDSVTPMATLESSGEEAPFHLVVARALRAMRFLARKRVLYFTAWRSILSMASPMACDISAASATPTNELLRMVTVISAMLRFFSVARITCVSKVLPSIFCSFKSPCSTCLRSAGVTSYCRPVNSTFMYCPLAFHGCTTFPEINSVHMICGLVLHPPLMCAGNAHVLTILGDRAPCHLNTLRLQDTG